MNRLIILFALYLLMSAAVRAETLPYNYYDTTSIPIYLSITELLTTKLF